LKLQITVPKDRMTVSRKRSLSPDCITCLTPPTQSCFIGGLCCHEQRSLFKYS